MSWSEILPSYVESFYFYQNRFLFMLTREILWPLWEDMNKEIFQLNQLFVLYAQSYSFYVEKKRSSYNGYFQEDLQMVISNRVYKDKNMHQQGQPCADT